MQSAFGTLPSDANAQWTGVAADDRAARYMAWMALGGTSVNIPIPILQIVAITKVLDQRRVLDSTSLSANMLSQAKALCLGLVGPTRFGQKATFAPGDGKGYLDGGSANLNTSLILQNGDAELWLRLCSAGNPPPIHVLTVGDNKLDVTTIVDSSFSLAIDGPDGVAPGTLLQASVYPASTPVGNERGGIDASLLSTNEWPWCIDDTGATKAQEAWLDANGGQRCPSSVIAASANCKPPKPGGPSCFGNDAANAWAVHGAINAGLSVFLYVQSLEKSTPPPDYNQCELLR
jgi:hypothetical protein